MSASLQEKVLEEMRPEGYENSSASLTRVEKLEHENALEELKKFKHVLPRIDGEYYQAEIDEFPRGNDEQQGEDAGNEEEEEDEESIDPLRIERRKCTYINEY